ncbi:MAG TPA: hypothetical protein PKA41_08685 [Verrucomicrobiota bacterium]|nr:hypothetical protein [Verrucomicrobiota bacterium]
MIIVESLFGQRDMSRGAKVYFTLPLLEDYTVAAEKRRLSNLRQNRKTNEKPLILPKCSDCTSEDDAASIAERLGVGLRTFFQAKELRQTLHDPRCSWLAEQSGLKAGSADLVKLQASLRAEFEPQLVSGEKGLWFVNSAIAGRLTTADKERNAGDAAQLDFWAGHLHPLMSAVQTWKKVPREVRQRVINDLRGLLRRLPEDDRTAILEGLESAR